MWFSSSFLLVTTSLTSSSLGEILDVGPGRRCYCVTGARWAQKVRQFYWMWASTMSHWSFWISDLEAPWRCYRTDHEYSGPRPWHIQPWIQIIFQTCGRRLGAEYPDTALYYPATDEDATENVSMSGSTAATLGRYSVAKVFIFQRSNSTRPPSTLCWTFCCREVTFGYVVDQNGLNA